MSVCNEVDSTYMFCCLNLILLRMGCCTCEWSELYFSASKNATSLGVHAQIGYGNNISQVPRLQFLPL